MAIVKPETWYRMFWIVWTAGVLIAAGLLLYFVVTRPIVAALLSLKGTQ